jgi:hypothetical protein
MLVESDLHSLNDGMAPAAEVGEILTRKFLVNRIVRFVDHRQRRFGKEYDFSHEPPRETLGKAFGPNGLCGWRDIVDWECRQSGSARDFVRHRNVFPNRTKIPRSAKGFGE